MKIVKYVLGISWAAFALLLIIQGFSGSGAPAVIFGLIVGWLAYLMIRSGVRHDLKQAMPKWKTLSPKVDSVKSRLYSASSFESVKEWQEEARGTLAEIQGWIDEAEKYASEHKDKKWLQNSIGITLARGAYSSLSDQINAAPVDAESKKALLAKFKQQQADLKLDKRENTLDRKNYSRKSTSYTQSMQRQAGYDRKILDQDRMIQWLKYIE